LRGGQKKLRIISTPNGLANKFAELWFNTAGKSQQEVKEKRERRASSRSSSLPPVQNSGLYFKSKVTVHEAIANGLPLDVEELRTGLNDEDAWAQEYLCEFTDDSKILFPYDLIESCETSLASETASEQSLSASILPDNGRAPELFAGVDFARKNHFTVCWILERVRAADGTAAAAAGTAALPMQYITREVLCLKDLATPDQLELLLPRLRRCRTISLDYTGPGVGLGDYLQKELNNGVSGISAQRAHQFRNYTHKVWQLSAARLELCQFTTAFKSELFPRLRAAFERRELQIPSSRDIREDLHSLYSTVTNTGQVLYRAPSTPGGHADRATALALAVRAAQSVPANASSGVISRRSINDIACDPYYQNPPRTLAIIY
jgi:phage FluMu gp28-like protein